MKTYLSILVAVVATLSSPVRGASTVLDSGHVDIFGVGYVGGALELLIHDEDSAQELEPADAILRVNPGAYVPRPAGTAFNFLGASGTSLWILPQSETTGLLYAGFGTEEVDPDAWGANRPITITLLSVVSAPTDGNFFLWQENEFGNPTQFMNSTDLANFNSVSQNANVHSHFNWGFTAEGIYKINFEATGTPEGGSLLSSGTQTYTFNVVPEPSSGALLLAGFAAVFAARRMRR